MINKISLCVLTNRLRKKTLLQSKADKYSASIIMKTAHLENMIK